MHRLVCLFFIVSVFIFPLYNQAFGDCKMSANSDTIVIQWYSEGGLERLGSDTADLTVFADGRVVVGPRFANGKVTKHQLSEADLAALCRFVFEQQDIWSIDADAIEREVKAVDRSDADVGSRSASAIPLGPQAIADAAMTSIRVRGDDGRHHEVRYYNLVGAAQRYPQIDKLQRLRAIEMRLLELAQQVAASS
jgi:hypothetical protein